MLTLRDSNGAIAKTNDDWQNSAAADLAAINASGLAPTNAQESAIFTDLAPGAYTAIVEGKSGDSGVALVEVYQQQ